MGIKPRPLTHCPLCRYDLTGLPARHRCPECGFEYDETVLVFRTPIMPRLVLLVAWIGLAAVVPSDCRRGLTQWLGLPGRDSTLVLLFVTAVVPFLGMFYPRGLVVLAPAGLTYRSAFGAAQFIPWRDIRRRPWPLGIVRCDGGAARPVRLPIAGLRRGHRRRLQALIATRLQGESLPEAPPRH